MAKLVINNESQAVDVKDILVMSTNPFTGLEQNIGTFKGQNDWGIFIAEEPAKPSNCITLYDEGGPPPVAPVNKKGSDWETQTALLQVRVRSTDYETGHWKITQIYNALQALGPYQTTIFRYSAFYAQGVPVYLTSDNNNRQTFVVNFNCFRARGEVLGVSPSPSPSASP